MIIWWCENRKVVSNIQNNAKRDENEPEKKMGKSKQQSELLDEQFGQINRKKAKEQNKNKLLT